MSEIERILKEEIDRVNKAEHRDNRPRFSISFIKKHPGLFVGMYLAYAATLAVMLQSETLADVTWVMTLLFVGLNLFFFLTSIHAITTTISTFWICAYASTANGITREWCRTRWSTASCNPLR